MSLWVWIAVVAGIVLSIWLVVALVGTPKRRRAAQREKAAQLRREAEEKLALAARREVVASQEEAGARREREAAEQALRHAERVDPDLPESPSAAETAAADTGN
jgi:hypothetical protein